MEIITCYPINTALVSQGARVVAARLLAHFAGACVAATTCRMPPRKTTTTRSLPRIGQTQTSCVGS